MIYSFSVQEPYKSFLLSGEKTVEGRLNTGKFENIQEGDTLVMDTGERFIVLFRKEYRDFSSMLEDVGIQKTLPDKKQISEGVQVYYQFYTKEMEEMYGVVGIGLCLI